MNRSFHRGALWGVLFAIGLVGVVASGQAATPTASPPARGKLERLRIAVAPTGYDTNFTWLQGRSAQLDKRPALEYLIGIDRHTGAYIPELAEKWEMSPDGRTWTITLRRGIKFIDSTREWGAFTAKDVRHAVFLITQPEAIQTDAAIWRTLIGVAKTDTIEDVAKKVAEGVEIVDDHQVVFHLKSAAPEFLETLSANTDLGMESKARWDAGGKELYGQKVVGTGPFEFVERKVGSHVLYKRVENHWRQTPEYKELEFRWVPEGVTRLATLLAEEMHISDVERALQQDAVAKGMRILTSKLPAIQHQWHFGGLYFASPEKLDPKVPFVDKRVRQAMNMAINRQAIADNLLGGRVEPHRTHGYHPQLDGALWPGIWNPDWDRRFDELYGYNPTKAKMLLEQAGYAKGFEFTLYLAPLPGLPEMVDIGQALALDWQAIGLKPKLVEMEFTRVRELYRTKTIHGGVWPLRHALRALDTTRLFHKSKDGVVYSYEHPFIEERLEALGKTVEPAERARLLREIGDQKFYEFAEIPLFWLFAEAAVNPKFIAEYVFPGTITGFYTHLEYIKLAP
ncbi:MAG: ABC transporter substrate-binding protein [Nitrospinae bacterium]|nr:ABC transporter substrate-binding protein [Nitrospinota bacterium]